MRLIEMNNKDKDIEKLRELIKAAKDAGAEVTVTAINKKDIPADIAKEIDRMLNGKTKSKYNIGEVNEDKLNKISKDLDNIEKEVEKELDKLGDEVKNLLMNGMKESVKGKTDYEVFRGCVQSFGKLVQATGRNPRAGVVIMATNDGDISVNGINLPTKGAVKDFLKEVIEAHDEDRLVEDDD